MSRQPPLHEVHCELGATFTEFAGWSMPLRYGSAIDEHHAVRAAAGIFDLSHMGQIEITGPGVVTALNQTVVSDMSKVRVGRAKYTMCCDDAGGIIDDFVIYRLAEDRYMLVANAANTDTVAAFLKRHIDPSQATVTDTSDQWALIAVQGPTSAAIVEKAAGADVEPLRYFAAEPARIADADVLLARTGYTGEDGFEIYSRTGDATRIWVALTDAGQPHKLVPAGLACRDSLRLEAGMPLYGQELTRNVTPFEAGAGRLVAMDKPDSFVGQEALRQRKHEGPAMTLVGLSGSSRRSPRTGHTILAPDSGKPIGEVTSGVPSPTLKHPIAMGYVPTAYQEPGIGVLVDIRGNPEPYEVTNLPFYRRAK